MNSKPATAQTISPPADAALAGHGAAEAHRLRRALALGLLGVFIFALSIPMTRLASGSAAAPRLDAVFVALGRAALAGLCSIAYLVAVRARWPRREE